MLTIPLKIKMIKKFLVLLTISLCSVAHAEYTAKNKIIKVVIPQSVNSGLGFIYNEIEAYARTQQITMIPVFKPGADGRIGIDYASKQQRDTLLFSTISDYAHADVKFVNVSLISKTPMVLVASKNSKIMTTNDIIKQQKEQAEKLTWGYASSVQLGLINTVAVVNNIEPTKMYKVPFSVTAGFQTSIVNGDIDLAFILPPHAESLSAAGRLTIVEIDEHTKNGLAAKENSTALFLPSNSSADLNKFWNKFTNGLLNDPAFKKAMSDRRIESHTNADRVKLTNAINGWKL